MTKLKVLIVDDNPCVIKGLKGIIGVENDIEIVGDAKTGTEAISMSSELVPDVLLMDAGMLGSEGGFSAALYIKKHLPDIKVLFLTVHSGYMEDALAAGADGYLMKDCQATDLVEKIKEVCMARTILN